LRGASEWIRRVAQKKGGKEQADACRRESTDRKNYV